MVISGEPAARRDTVTETVGLGEEKSVADWHRGYGSFYRSIDQFAIDNGSTVTFINGQLSIGPL